MSTSYSPDHVNELVLSKGELKLWIELRLLISWSWDGNIILHYPGGPSLLTEDLTRGHGRKTWEKQRDGRGRRLDQRCWLWRRRIGAWAKKCRCASCWKGQDAGSPLQPLGRTEPCWYLCFSPGRPILNLWLSRLQDNVRAVLSHQVCDNVFK